jgi:hypothetical protein
MRPCLPDEVGNAVRAVLGHLSEERRVVVAGVTALHLLAVSNGDLHSARSAS